MIVQVIYHRMHSFLISGDDFWLVTSQCSRRNCYLNCEKYSQHLTRQSLNRNHWSNFPDYYYSIFTTQFSNLDPELSRSRTLVKVFHMNSIGTNSSYSEPIRKTWFWFIRIKAEYMGLIDHHYFDHFSSNDIQNVCQIGS